MTRSAVHVSSKTAQAACEAAVVESPEKVRLERMAVPHPGPGQVRVRLEGCGVCASNIPPWEGREWFDYPMAPGALGHEGYGRVDALGEGVTGVREGQRVSFIGNHSYAQYDVADAGSLVELPESLDGRAFPAEPLGCAVNVIKRSAIMPGQLVAVVGCGFLGCLLVRLARDAGAKVMAISRRPFALQSAEAMGADELVVMDDHWRIIDHVRTLTGGQMCDCVIEATGKQWPLDLSAELTRERGRLVVAGYHQDGLRSVNMQLWNWRGLDVVSAHERDPAVYLSGMREAVRLVEQGRLDPAPLLTHEYELADLGEALAATRDRPEGFMKAVIDLSQRGARA